MRAFVLFVLMSHCAGSPASPSSTPPSTPASPSPSPPPQSSAAGPPAQVSPPPTGGSVLIGEIPGTKQFNPKPAMDDSKSALLDCYNRVRASRPQLSGKLMLRIVVNQSGRAVAVEAEPGGSANEPALVACIRDALGATVFPKPPGMAAVTAPLLFRP